MWAYFGGLTKHAKRCDWVAIAYCGLHFEKLKMLTDVIGLTFNMAGAFHTNKTSEFSLAGSRLWVLQAKRNRHNSHLTLGTDLHMRAS